MVNLHQDDDGSTDDEEKAVQVGSDILSVLRKILSINLSFFLYFNYRLRVRKV